MPQHKAQVLDRENPALGFCLRVPCLTRLDEAEISSQLESDQFFWLDLTDPSTDELERLGKLFDFHPLAIEDTVSFGQRPKLDDYGTHVYLVFYGMLEPRGGGQGRLSEVHIFLSGKFMVTIHRAQLPALDQQRTQISGRVIHSEQFVVYRVLDALTDTFFPSLADMDDEIDQLENGIVLEPRTEQLQRIFSLKRELIAMRKVVTPQRDLLARGIDAIAEIPGFQLDERDYFRDVYDHLIRISDLIDSYRDLLAGAMDAYLSTVANRQNDVMKQLTVIATVFLPLSFLTGFFGMNFSFMINHIENTAVSFVILGVGGCVASAVALWVYFKRKQWT